MVDQQDSSRLPVVLIFGAIAFIAIVGVSVVLLGYGMGGNEQGDAPPAESIPSR
jgi:hypothetical protein